MIDLLHNVWEMFLFFIKLQFLRKNGISEKIEGHSPQHPPASDAQLERGGGGASPALFWKSKKYLILSIFELIFLFKV